MSRRRSLRRGLDPANPKMRAMLFAHVLSSTELAEVASDGDTPCDVRPDNAPTDVRCPFRKGTPARAGGSATSWAGRCETAPRARPGEGASAGRVRGAHVSR